MIFVDTSVFMYAVGGRHPLRERARSVFETALEEGAPLVSSAEVLQELMHAYVPVGRVDTLDAALTLAEARLAEVWAVEADDVRHARLLLDRYRALDARDLLHLACCRRRDVGRIRTFDRALASAFGGTAGE